MKASLDREGTGPERNSAEYRIRKAQVIINETETIPCILPHAHSIPQYLESFKKS